MTVTMPMALSLLALCCCFLICLIVVSELAAWKKQGRLTWQDGVMEVLGWTLLGIMLGLTAWIWGFRL